MQCKISRGSPLSSSSSPSSSSSLSPSTASPFSQELKGIEMAWSQVLTSSPLQEGTNSSNILFPHQIGSVDSSCSSWPGHVWRREHSKYWLESDFNNNNSNTCNNNNNTSSSSSSRGRVSISSVCSDISDIFMSSDIEDSDSSGESSRKTSTASLELGLEVPQVQQQLHPLSLVEEDPNNNNFDQDSNNNITVLGENYNGTPFKTHKVNFKKNNKENSIKSRLVDEDGYIRRAACVCLDETESKVLLVSSKKDPCSWLVPGGGLEAGEDMATSAIREAWEEAGVQGHITKYLGLFETNQKNGNKKHRTAVFVVSVKQVMADYPESYLGRGRQWFTLEDAYLHLARTRPLQSAYLQLLLVSRLNAATS